MNGTEKFVLYVEDNPDDIELTAVSFEKCRFPYRMEVVHDGAEALDFLFASGKYKNRDKGDTPVLIILDLNLPKVHGLEVLRRIRATRWLKYVTVVVLTSSNEERDRVDAESLGANLYMQKPVDFDEFAKIAEKITGLLAAFPPRP